MVGMANHVHRSGPALRRDCASAPAPHRIEARFHHQLLAEPAERSAVFALRRRAGWSKAAGIRWIFGRVPARTPRSLHLAGWAPRGGFATGRCRIRHDCSLSSCELRRTRSRR